MDIYEEFIRKRDEKLFKAYIMALNLNYCIETANATRELRIKIAKLFNCLADYDENYKIDEII
jgi:hypothetical protein